MHNQYFNTVEDILDYFQKISDETLTFTLQENIESIEKSLTTNPELIKLCSRIYDSCYSYGWRSKDVDIFRFSHILKTITSNDGLLEDVLKFETFSEYPQYPNPHWFFSYIGAVGENCPRYDNLMSDGSLVNISALCDYNNNESQDYGNLLNHYETYFGKDEIESTYVEEFKNMSKLEDKLFKEYGYKVDLGEDRNIKTLTDNPQEHLNLIQNIESSELDEDGEYEDEERIFAMRDTVWDHLYTPIDIVYKRGELQGDYIDERGIQRYY